MGSKPRYKQPVKTKVERLAKVEMLDGDASAADAAHILELYRDIYTVIAQVPKGRVLTYGQVAELAGRPGAARVVGTALRVSAKNLGLPWQRIVGRRSRDRAQVSILDPVGGAIQRLLLEEEGVLFSVAGGIDLTRFGWLPALTIETG